MDPYLEMVKGEQAQARRQAAGMRLWKPIITAGLLVGLGWRAVTARFRPEKAAPDRVVRPIREVDRPSRQRMTVPVEGVVCLRCTAEVPADDIALLSSGGRVLCLACYGRQTGTAALAPEPLRRQVLAVLEAIPDVEPAAREPDRLRRTGPRNN